MKYAKLILFTLIYLSDVFCADKIISADDIIVKMPLSKEENEEKNFLDFLKKTWPTVSEKTKDEFCNIIKKDNVAMKNLANCFTKYKLIYPELFCEKLKKLISTIKVKKSNIITSKEQS